MKRFPQIRSAAIWWVMTIIYVVTYFAQVFTGRDPDALLPLLICAGVATILMTLHEINVRVTVIQKTQRDEVVNKVLNLVRQEFLVKQPRRGAEPTFTVFDENLGRNNDTIGDEQ